MSKILTVIASILVIALALVFATMYWPIVLVFVVVGLYSLYVQVFEIKNTLIIKLIFIGLYFLALALISNYLHEHNIKLTPDIDNEYHCMNGYVCD